MADSKSPCLRLLLGALLASLALNAVQVFRAAQARSADRAPPPSASGAVGGDALSARPSTSGGGAAAPASEGLRAGDPEALRDWLVAAGVETKLRRRLLETVLMDRFEPRFRALYPQNEPDPAVWWRDPGFEEAAGGREAVARQRRAQELQQEYERELARLTGEDPRAPRFDENPWLARQYAGLPPAKAEALHRLQADYQEIEQQIRMEAGSFELPSDQEKLRLLREEKERDLAELLSPEERARWELRASPTADRTRQLATQYRASEEEYTRLFALQRAFDARFEPEHPDGATGEIDWKEREAARAELERAVRAIVGEERYLSAKRENDTDYVLARAAADRLGLPPETATRLHGLRVPAAEESRRIAEDARLGPAEKRAALQRLAASTRAEVERALGAEAAKSFFERGGMPWLQAVERGARVVLTDEGVDTRDIEGIGGEEADAGASAGSAPPWSRSASWEAPVIRIE